MQSVISIRGLRKTYASGHVALDGLEAIAADMKANGGLITKEDLARYAPEWREPIRSTYRGYSIVAMPPFKAILSASSSSSERRSRRRPDCSTARTPPRRSSRSAWST